MLSGMMRVYPTLINFFFFFFFFFLALKAQNAESRFLIERIGLKAAYSIKPPHIKSSPLERRRKQHSKEKSHFQTLSGHVGVKRQFNTQNSLIPRPFDVSSVKGKMPI